MNPTDDTPRLRPIEAFPVEERGERLLVVHDPVGLAAGSLVVPPAAAVLLTLMDGHRNQEEIVRAFERRTGERLDLADLDRMVQQLEEARFLDSPGFAAWFEGLVRDYRAGDARVSGDAHSFGADGDGLPEFLDRILGGDQRATPRRGRLAGLVAPHLDYPRGMPCYAEAYGLLRSSPRPERVVILGTNHFGRATSCVATGKDFLTPLGRTATDRAFIELLDARLDADLCHHEFDHQREHSIELQVLMLQHLLGPDRFSIVPVLCHDPCGPNGTAPYDGNGVDLRAFGEALGELVRADATPTLIIAGADFSHIGQRFGDHRDLDASFLGEVESRDRAALHALESFGPDAFVDNLRAHDNSSRVCSAGCIFALTTALPDARRELLRYHQAADRSSGTGVTCAAMALWSDG